MEQQREGVPMLTQDALNKTWAHNTATGQGKHVFGQEGTKPVVTVPRDKDARPKSSK